MAHKATSKGDVFSYRSHPSRDRGRPRRREGPNRFSMGQGAGQLPTRPHERCARDGSKCCAAIRCAVRRPTSNFAAISLRLMTGRHGEHAREPITLDLKLPRAARLTSCHFVNGDTPTRYKTRT